MLSSSTVLPWMKSVFCRHMHCIYTGTHVWQENLWALDFSSASLLELFDQIDKYIYLCLKIIKILFESGTTEDLLFSVLWFVSLFMTHLASTLCFVSPPPVSLYYDWGNRLERKKEFSWGNSQRSATHWCSKSNSKKAAEPTEAHEVWTSYRRPPRMNWS